MALPDPVQAGTAPAGRCKYDIAPAGSAPSHPAPSHPAPSDPAPSHPAPAQPSPSDLPQPPPHNSVIMTSDEIDDVDEMVLPAGKTARDAIGNGSFALVIEWTADTVMKCPLGQRVERELLETEQRIYERLTGDGFCHPGILRHVENREEGIVLGLARGGTLRSRLGRRDRPPVPLPVRLAWAAQVAEAMAYVHSRGVIHADIGGHNVFLDPDDPAGPEWEQHETRAMLGDFAGSSIDGLAPAVGCGDGFSHPSIRDVSEKVDIFAFGSLLFELLSGSKPPRALSRGEIPQLAQVLDQVPALGRVIHLCWTDQYASMSEVVVDIQMECVG